MLAAFSCLNSVAAGWNEEEKEVEWDKISSSSAGSCGKDSIHSAFFGSTVSSALGLFLLHSRQAILSGEVLKRVMPAAQTNCSKAAFMKRCLIFKS